MTIHTIGDGALALFLAREDLQREGIDPQGPDLAQAAALARRTFRQAGLQVASCLEIEAFAGSGALVIFARLLGREKRFFAFFDFEDLLCAVGQLPPRARGRLWYMADRYYLELTGSDASLIPSEFADSCHCDDEYAARAAAEAGTLIFDGGELSRFYGFFA